MEKVNSITLTPIIKVEKLAHENWNQSVLMKFIFVIEIRNLNIELFV